MQKLHKEKICFIEGIKSLYKFWYFITIYNQIASHSHRKVPSKNHPPLTIHLPSIPSSDPLHLMIPDQKIQYSPIWSTKKYFSVYLSLIAFYSFSFYTKHFYNCVCIPCQKDFPLLHRHPWDTHKLSHLFKSENSKLQKDLLKRFQTQHRTLKTQLW